MEIHTYESLGKIVITLLLLKLMSMLIHHPLLLCSAIRLVLQHLTLVVANLPPVVQDEAEHGEGPTDD